MKIAFFIAAALMVALALALLLLPLLRHGRRQGHSRHIFVLALVIAFVLPLSAAGLYLLVGTPVALDGVPSQQKMTADIDQAIHKLRAHLTTHPDDVQGWMLLAQAATDMQQPDEAHEAYDRVLALTPNNATAMVGWAETDAMVREDHRIQGRARVLLQQAVKLEPNNQRGLWLLGISQFQADQYAQAAATWRLLQPLLTPGSKVAQAVATQIAMADARAGHVPADAASPSSATTVSTPASTAASTALTVQVSLAPALKNKLKPGDTLFVYARAEHGPPMPLAVAKLPASRLPATVRLTDAMGMLPQMKLSSARQVYVGARVSHSGQAIAQSGDLEGDAGVVAVDSNAPVKIVIDHIHG
ncbi:tetratricopeptide repeat protein [Dyella sp. A6]|uniref:tetratricopeptide repeat protein n=1 Tax=Dyella aluminiiresistens TaxID=3069105 RepID=UPI002E7A14C2|nr:tetratricopeptide repeat protein [Dyella sp. A6]